MVSTNFTSPILMPLRRCDGVRRERHRFLAAGDDDIGVAACDLLDAERDRAQAGAADLIDPEGGLFLRNAGLDRRLARRILALRGGEHLAENHFVHFARLDLGALESGLDGDRAELVGGGRAERAVERANRGSLCAGDDDLGIGHDWLPLEQDERRDDRTSFYTIGRRGRSLSIYRPNIWAQSGAPM